MSLDTFTISALVDELSETIVGGRVQDIIDVDAMAIGLEVYARGKRYYLLLSADAAEPRVQLAEAKLRRGAIQPTQLGLLFRRHIEGGIVSAVSQPPWERLLQIEIQTHDGRFEIIAEIMPRRANVLLVRDGLILDCLNRVGPDDNRYRLSLPNHKYIPPPPLRDQLDPIGVSAADMTRLLGSADKPTRQLRRLLPGAILGLSPLLAKEIAFRASGDARAIVADTDGAALYESYRELVRPLLRRQWQPGIGSVDGVAAEVSVFPLRQMEWQACPSVSQAIAQYAGLLRGPDAYRAAKRPVEAAIAEAKAKVKAKAASLQRNLKDDSDLELLRQSGELILAYQFAVQAEQTELRAQYDLDAPELVIRLDPGRSPLENAQDYFRRYEKAKSAAEALPRLIDEARLELNFLEQLESDLQVASNWPEIDDVIQILAARGHWQGKPVRRMGGGRQGPLRVVSRDGYVIWVGRNSRQNETVTFKKANPQDIWLHARQVPGAHVVIRNDGRRIKEELIAAAAAVAAWYSKRRADSSVPVDYTRVKYVKAIRGAGPGMVTYRNETTLSVRPRDESILS